MISRWDSDPSIEYSDNKKGTVQTVPFKVSIFKLSTLNFAGSKTSRANMKSLCSSVYLAVNGLNVGAPNSVRSSMRMAYVISKMNTFSTYSTLCHF